MTSESPLCRAGRHELCGSMSDTGCPCRCHAAARAEAAAAVLPADSARSSPSSGSAPIVLGLAAWTASLGVLGGWMGLSMAEAKSQAVVSAGVLRGVALAAAAGVLLAYWRWDARTRATALPAPGPTSSQQRPGIRAATIAGATVFGVKAQGQGVAMAVSVAVLGGALLGLCLFFASRLALSESRVLAVDRVRNRRRRGSRA